MKRAVLSVLVVMMGGLALAGQARAEVSPAQAEQAAANGAAWFQLTQNEEGALAAGLGGGNRFGEWSLTALAAGDVNAADSRTSLRSASAQSYYDDFWTFRGPGAVACPGGGDNPTVCDQQPDGLPTDSARTVLSSIAGGLQPNRISTDRDYVSRLAFWWSGDQVGYRDLLNDDIFAILALAHAGAPEELLQTLALNVRSQQLPDGGWHWRAATAERPIPAGVASDTDMTAAAIGALCAAGAIPADDEQIKKGLALIEERQSIGQGGFSTSASPTGTNTNTTAWVTSAFNACGIDPQNDRWTTTQGKTPFDFLLGMQNNNGSFRYMPSNPAGSANLMATYQAVSPLGGNDWTGEAPARTDDSDPRIKPAPSVTPGTIVPLTLVIDHGKETPLADRSRMCRVEVPEGSDLSQVLDTAEGSSAPGNCVENVTTSLKDGAVEVDSANGGEGTWTVEVNGEGEAESADNSLGLGDMVVLRFKGTQQLSPPAVEPVPQIEGEKPEDPTGPTGPTDATDPIDPVSDYSRATVLGKPQLKAGKVRARVHCPATAAPAGCADMATFALRRPAKKSFRAFAATAAEIPAGRTRVLSARAGKQFRKTLRRAARKGSRGRALIRVTVGTRSADGVVRYARGLGVIRGR